MARPLLLALGWLCVGLGIVGLVLPLMPGTVFLIIAAACFARASPRFEHWLLTHPRLGPPVAAWRRHGVIPPVAKAFACGSLVLSFGIILAIDVPLLGAATAGVCMVAVATYILTRPSRPRRDQRSDVTAG